MVRITPGHLFCSGLFSAVNFVDLVQIPWKGLCHRCQGHVNHFISLFCPWLNSNGSRKASRNYRVDSEPMCSGAEQGLLQGGIQIHPQGQSLWWAIYILHFINASLGLFTRGKIIQWFAYISMADRNTMCSWRAIREMDCFFLFLFTLLLLDGSSSLVHQYIMFFSYMGANFPTSLSLL